MEEQYTEEQCNMELLLWEFIYNVISILIVVGLYEYCGPHYTIMNVIIGFTIGIILLIVTPLYKVIWIGVILYIAITATYAYTIRDIEVHVVDKNISIVIDSLIMPIYSIENAEGVVYKVVERKFWYSPFQGDF